MSCSKFSLLLAMILASTFAFASDLERFTPKECLMASYDTTVTHKGDLWGLMKKDLTVKKNECEIIVLDKGILDSDWKVDVCREPIHVKATSKGSLSVHKRAGKCEQDNQNEFCESWSQLKGALEDKGLIFAEGERERLSTSHGKVYCAYLLLRKHLDDGVLFSKYQEPVDIYQNGLKKPSGEAKPAQNPVEATQESSDKVEAQGRF